MGNPLYVGVVGANGSGKTTFCQYLQSQGFFHVSLSKVVRDVVSEKGLPEERDSLIAHANALKEEFGMTYFAQCCMEQVIESGSDCVVFDSIRHPDEVAYLKERGVVVIGLTVGLEDRYARISERQHQTDSVSLETFKVQDETERSGASLGQSIDVALNRCDYRISNDGDLDALHARIDEVLAQIKEQA